MRELPYPAPVDSCEVDRFCLCYQTYGPDKCVGFIPQEAFVMVDGTATAAGGRLTEEQKKDEEKPGGAMEETCAVPLEIPAGRAIPDLNCLAQVASAKPFDRKLWTDDTTERGLA